MFFSVMSAPGCKACFVDARTQSCLLLAQVSSISYKTAKRRPCVFFGEKAGRFDALYHAFDEEMMNETACATVIFMNSSSAYVYTGSIDSNGSP